MLSENEMMPAKTLAYIQAAVKAPKGKYNSFGKYYYRSAEDIMEAVKPIINPLGYWLMVTDSIELIGSRYYVKSLAVLTNGSNVYQVTGYAREDENRKGMDSAMVTGSAASYARKYALQGLFALDQNKDSDDLHHEGTDQQEIENAKMVNEEWKTEINACKTIDQLTQLYNQNKESVDGNPAIKKMFSERKTQLK